MGFAAVAVFLFLVYSLVRFRTSTTHNTKKTTHKNHDAKFKKSRHCVYYIFFQKISKYPGLAPGLAQGG